MKKSIGLREISCQYECSEFSLWNFQRQKMIFEEEYFLISCPETVDKHEVEPCQGDFIS